MKLNEPKVITWWISVILGVLALIALLVPSLGLGAYAIWLALAGLLLLVLANVLKGL